MFPIGSLSTEDLFNLNNFNVQSFVDSALSFEITSGLTNWPNLTDYDTDENLPLLSTLAIPSSMNCLLLVPP